jgi:hypothetical protein
MYRLNNNRSEEEFHIIPQNLILLIFDKVGKVPNSMWWGVYGQVKNKLRLVGRQIPAVHQTQNLNIVPLHPCPEQYEKSFMFSHSLSILILSSHLYLGLSSCLLPSRLHTKALYVFIFSHMRAASPTHLKTLDISKFLKSAHQNAPFYGIFSSRLLLM